MNRTLTRDTQQPASFGVAPPCWAPSGCQLTPNTIEFGIPLKAVDLLSNTAQWANASTLSATGGLFINDIHARWSLRVAVGGDAAKDSSPYLLFFYLFFFAIEKEKSRDVCFFAERRL